MSDFLGSLIFKCSIIIWPWQAAYQCVPALGKRDSVLSLTLMHLIDSDFLDQLAQRWDLMNIYGLISYEYLSADWWRHQLICDVISWHVTSLVSWFLDVIHELIRDVIHRRYVTSFNLIRTLGSTYQQCAIHSHPKAEQIFHFSTFIEKIHKISNANLANTVLQILLKNISSNK